MIFWVYVLAPWIADPGLVIIAEYQGWTWLYDSVAGTFFGGLSYEWACSSWRPSPTSSRCSR